MKITLVRHGQPDWSPNGRVSNDPSLTELGEAQAQRLTHRHWGHVDHLWVSPLVRAAQTAHPLEDQLGSSALVHDWMAEIAPAPGWEGSPIEELEQHLVAVNQRPVEELWDGFPGAESFRDFHRRVVEGLDASLLSLGVSRVSPESLWSDAPDVHVLLVAHGGTNAVIIGHLLGVGPAPWEWDRFDSAHTSVATLTTRPIAGATAFGMTGFGDVTHLDPNMVTR